MIPRERAGTPPDPRGANMKGDDLRALLGRLESATGPDRELDAALQWALVGRHLETDARWRPLFDRDAAAAWDKVCGQQWRASDEPVPHLTVSLDAVVALLDRFGMSWSKSMEGFVCLHDREGAGAFRPDAESTALPIKLMAGMIRALIARTEPSPDA